MHPSGEQFELRHGEQRAVVVELGGALRAYEAGGRPVLDGYGADEMCSAARGQTLIPWPNRLRDGTYSFEGEELQLPLSEPAKHNAIHGLVRWTRFTAADRAENRVRMEQLLLPQAGYPFALSVAIEYALGDDGLTVTTTAENAGTRDLPFGAGAHPYLTAGTETVDECTLRAPGARRMVTDEQAIPTGEEPAVDGTEYDFRTARELGAVQLDTGYADLVRDADGRARVELSAPGGPTVGLWLDEAYPYLMLFTGDSLPEAERRRRGLGVEPMSCAPNALASGEGLVTLAPGGRWRGSWGIEPG